MSQEPEATGPLSRRVDALVRTRPGPDRPPLFVLSPEDSDEFRALPLERLGDVLRTHRLACGESLPTVARRLNWQFTPTALRLIEGGQYPLTNGAVKCLLAGYGSQPQELDRDRLAVDVDRGRLISGPHEWTLDGLGRVHSVLFDYVRFVREMRGMDPGARLSTASIRDDDMGVLAQALDRDPEGISAAVRGIVAPGDIDAGDFPLIARALDSDVATVEAHLAALTGRPRRIRATTATASPETTDTRVGTRPHAPSPQSADVSAVYPVRNERSSHTGSGEPSSGARPFQGRRKSGILERLG